MRRALIAALAHSGERAAQQHQRRQWQPLALAVAAARPVTMRSSSTTSTSTSAPAAAPPPPPSPSWLYDPSLLPGGDGGSNDEQGGSTPVKALDPPRLVAPTSAAATGAPSSRRRSSSSTPATLPLLDALRALRESRAAARARTDETVEMHVRLRGVDPRRGDHAVRGAALLPHSVAPPPRVAVFCEEGHPAAAAALAAGADVVGGAALLDEIVETRGKSIAFDRCVAHPDMAKALAKAGRVLGPRGLMPNAKVGTLTADVARAVRELRQGRLEFRADRYAQLHLPLGKLSSGDEKLAANAGALAAAVMAAKPEAVRGGLARLLARVTLATTFGKGSVAVEVGSVLEAADGAAAGLVGGRRAAA
jgi:large subunit ribosomal protein L1